MMEPEILKLLIDSFGQGAINIVALVVIARWYVNSQGKLIALFDEELKECRRDREALNTRLSELGAKLALMELKQGKNL